MPQETHELLLPEPEARRLLLAQALDETDTQHRLVGAAEREEIDRGALAATGDPALGQPLRSRLFLLERAGRLLDLLAHRQPAVAALQEPPAWRVLLAWGLPLLALLVGALIDRIDNPRQVNLLSPPLLAFLLWNIGVYLVLLVLALRPASARGPLGRLLGAGLGWPRRGPPVAQAFARRWSDAAAAVEARRRARILHVAAAAWGVGVALSIVLGGVVREYRVGWESTLLDAPQVHAFLRALFAPVVALLPVEGFSLQEVSRLHFGSGADVGRAEARRWVGLYVALLALVVVVPRVLLAAWAAAGERRLASRVRIDLAQPYYEALLGRVQPARLRLAWLPSDPGSAAVLEAILRQAAEAPPPSTAVPWTITATSRGDELLVTPQAQLAVPTLLPVEATPRSWLERWRAPVARPPA
ncbi:MAG TPA: DUF2868 domain-containing protein, partial [Ramlibacter sp.]|nr:DUF2868 domain-containing protein [Ramlibacter sp.]